MSLKTLHHKTTTNLKLSHQTVSCCLGGEPLTQAQTTLADNNNKSSHKFTEYFPTQCKPKTPEGLNDFQKQREMRVACWFFDVFKCHNHIGCCCTSMRCHSYTSHSLSLRCWKLLPGYRSVLSECTDHRFTLCGLVSGWPNLALTTPIFGLHRPPCLAR